MAAKPESVLSDLKNNKYAPVYFLQGDESYYIDKIAGYIEGNCLQEAEKGFNQVILYGKDTDMKTIISNAKRFPMMAERQVVIIKEAQNISDFNKAEGQKQLEAYVENPVPSTVLVFCYKYKTLDGRKGASKKLQKNAVLVTSKKIYDNQLPSFIESHSREQGLKVNPKASMMLAEFVGNNLSRLANEIDKVAVNLQKGETIDENHVEKYVGISKEYNVFELSNALGKKDIVKANRIVNYFEANSKTNPVMPLIVILFNYFQKVLMIHASHNKSEDHLVKILKVHKFFLKDYTTAARNYSAGKIISIIKYLRESDLKLKGVGNASATDGQILKELVFKILH